VTQQNAALVEQAAAAAESLQEQAQGLAESVSTFRLEGVAGEQAQAAAVLAGGRSRPLGADRKARPAIRLQG
jgi:methyl-accepting chemotaxis protein